MDAKPLKTDTRHDEDGRGNRRGQRWIVALSLALFGFGAVYAALAIAVRLDTILFPGSQLGLPGPIARLPGLDAGTPQDSPLTDRINILILGLDRRPHHAEAVDGPPRSDSMYVLSLDPVSKTGGLLGIPRDLYVEIPSPTTGGKGQPWLSRINTAYHYGSYYKYPGGGPALARETVERALKIKVNYYMTVDWVAFADIIDALGGIEVTVPVALQDVEAFNVRDANSFSIDIKAGTQPMDSITALAYSRFRGDLEGDLGRIRRQQAVMQAAMDKALSLGWLTSAPNVWSKYRSAFDTDIANARLPGLLNLGRQIGPDHLQMVSMAGGSGEAVRDVVTAEGEDVLIPVWERCAPLVQSVIWDRRLREEAAVVRVVNQTAVNGLARRGMEWLLRGGFTSADIGVQENVAGDRRAETVIYDYSGKEYSARKVAEALGLPRSVIKAQPASARAAGEADIVVVLGADARLPVDQIAAAFSVR